jgi:branched-chain amino acid transport system substrate-binding protein
MTSKKTLLAATRRALLLGAGGAAATRLAMPFIGNAAAEPIKIGVILAKTGQIVDQAEYLWQGTELALEQRNKTLLDRPVELIWLDEPSPQVAQQSMQKLIDGHKVCAVIGGTLSSSALAMEAVAGRAKIPFVINNAAATDITGKNCNRWTFRLQPPVAVQMRALAPYAMTNGKKWYFLTAAFAFGQDIMRSGRQILQEADGTEVGSDEVPLNTPDYSSFILKIRAAKPDVVLGGISAGDLTTFMKQWSELA